MPRTPRDRDWTGRTTATRWLAWMIATSPVLAPSAHAAMSEADAARLLAQAEPRLRAIYDAQDFAARSFRATWLPDGSGYMTLETPAGASGPEIASYDAASGKRTVLVSSAQLLVPGTSRQLAISEFVRSPVGQRFLLRTERGGDNQSGGRESEYWVFDSESGALRGVDAGLGVSLGPNVFSPDGARLLGARGANLFVFDIADGRLVALTQDGSPGTIENGRGGARWSPDGRHLVYVQSDSSAVGMRAVIVPGDPTYRTVRNERYSRVGTPIPALRIGVVSTEGGATRWIELADKSGTFHLDDVSWAGNSEELLVEKLSRYRDAREFLLVNQRTGGSAKAYGETDPAWVDAIPQANAGLEWIRDGKAFVLLSEKDGWRQAYVVSRDGSSCTPLTKGASDIITRGQVDESTGWFYYIASPGNATQRYLYRVRLDGTGEPERVTPPDQPGTHRYDFSPAARWAIHTYSTFDRPPVIDLVQLPEHRSLRVLEDNAAVATAAQPLITRPTEFLQLDIGGGVVMDAWLIKPRDFDPAQKYPVFVFVYGEPAGQTVLDDWSGGQRHTMFHRAVADLGYLVVSIDNRGTPAPKGAAWRRAVFGSLGPLSTEEQAAGLKELARLRPYVDLSRVGIWGWSGGGSNTLNAMFRKPEVYHVGIAVAPKPQPHLYNSGFQETYMHTREDNPEGYRQAAAINFAEGLRGHLLIVHGTGERNTHLEITEGLVDRLIELGKRFDYMAYPNRDHGLREGHGTEVHVRMLMIRYLIEHLSPGPR